MDKRIKTILKIISESKAPIGSAEIAEKLKEYGIEMPERTVRYHLKSINDQGLIQVHWKEGREITSKGLRELRDAFVSDKLGFMSSRIDNLSYQMDFNIDEKKGAVIINLTLIAERDFKKALEIMIPVFRQKLATGNRVAVARVGEELGRMTVPEGMVALGTVCSININGILLKHHIPMESKFGGLLQIENERPLRFTEIIEYSGSTLDPHEIFIKSRMTSVGVAVKGSGKILASLREIPAASVHEAEAIIRQIESAGLGGVLLIGKAGQTILGMTVGSERVGIVVPGGLNPVAAVEEWGIETESQALGTLIDYSRLVKFDSL
jgi:hypothetical protein